jgi:hypothetical protein
VRVEEITLPITEVLRPSTFVETPGGAASLGLALGSALEIGLLDCGGIRSERSPNRVPVVNPSRDGSWLTFDGQTEVGGTNILKV